MSDMPREIWARFQKDYRAYRRTWMIKDTPDTTHYVRASELAKAYEAIVELANEMQFLVHTADTPSQGKRRQRIIDKHAAIIKTAREQGK